MDTPKRAKRQHSSKFQLASTDGGVAVAQSQQMPAQMAHGLNRAQDNYAIQQIHVSNASNRKLVASAKQRLSADLNDYKRNVISGPTPAQNAAKKNLKHQGKVAGTAGTLSGVE